MVSTYDNDHFSNYYDDMWHDVASGLTPCIQVTNRMEPLVKFEDLIWLVSTKK